MIVARPVYEAVMHIDEQSSDYNPDNPQHETALAAGVAEVTDGVIHLTAKGELVREL